MESSFLTAVFLPLALFIIMLGMGLELTLDDFKRIFIEPKPVLLGLAAQLAGLPLVGFLLVSIFPLSPELAVGVMVLAACPGGPTSNLMTYLSKGSVALSITLTAISSLITILTIPLVVNLSMQRFLGESMALRLPFLPTVLQIAIITIIPVAIGMALHHYVPQFAARVEKGVKWLSIFFLALIIFGLLLKKQASLVGFFLQVGWVTLVLNVLTMALGYGLATLAGLERSITVAITNEVGIQNGTLAIAVASAPTLLDNPTIAVPAAIYSLIMFITGAAFATWSSSRSALGA